MAKITNKVYQGYKESLKTEVVNYYIIYFASLLYQKKIQYVKLNKVSIGMIFCSKSAAFLKLPVSK